MKPKDQGTRNETRWVDRFTDAGYVAWRLKEGGIHDEGDVAVLTGPMTDPDTWGFIMECRDRKSMNPHRALHEAEVKVAKADKLPFLPEFTVLQFKRLVRKDGNERRSADGLAEIINLSPESFMFLLDAAVRGLKHG